MIREYLESCGETFTHKDFSRAETWQPQNKKTQTFSDRNIKSKEECCILRDNTQASRAHASLTLHFTIFPPLNPPKNREALMQNHPSLLPSHHNHHNHNHHNHSYHNHNHSYHNHSSQPPHHAFHPPRQSISPRRHPPGHRFSVPVFPPVFLRCAVVHISPPATFRHSRGAKLRARPAHLRTHNLDIFKDVLPVLCDREADSYREIPYRAATVYCRVGSASEGVGVAGCACGFDGEKDSAGELPARER